MTSSASLCILVFILSLASITQAQRLSANFYDRRCPDLVPIVQSFVEQIVADEPRMGASLLRLHFHDCFVGGCDASVLLDTRGREKESIHNANSLRGFEEIDFIKGMIEVACPRVVSCADILTLVARDSVVALGGPSWPVLFGRRDSTTSASATNTNGQLPFPNNNLQQLIGLFAGKGFTPREMIALSGAHTIGQSRCLHFRNRIYGGQNIADVFAQSMQQICPATRGVGDDNLGPLDFATPDTFNNDYYEGLTRFEGLLPSDQVLFTGGGSRTDNLVRQYANNEQLFFNDFANAMLKMSRLGVKTGRTGMIRTNCRSTR